MEKTSKYNDFLFYNPEDETINMPVAGIFDHKK